MRLIKQRPLKWEASAFTREEQSQKLDQDLGKKSALSKESEEMYQNILEDAGFPESKKDHLIQIISVSQKHLLGFEEAKKPKNIPNSTYAFYRNHKEDPAFYRMFDLMKETKDFNLPQAQKRFKKLTKSIAKEESVQTVPKEIKRVVREEVINQKIPTAIKPVWRDLADEKFKCSESTLAFYNYVAKKKEVSVHDLRHTAPPNVKAFFNNQIMYAKSISNSFYARAQEDSQKSSANWNLIKAMGLNQKDYTTIKFLKNQKIKIDDINQNLDLAANKLKKSTKRGPRS